jgi:hypothetical protein
MTQFRSKISAHLPKALRPYLGRLRRRVDQIRGQPRAGRRRGVVLMLHVGRCGSTVLANMLAQDPEIYWDAKLHRKAQSLYGDSLKKMNHKAWLARQFSISGDRFYGFEFKILQDHYPDMAGLNLAEFLGHCRDIGVTHYILLVRRNTLRHVISHYASRNRGKWHFDVNETSQAQRFPLDLDNITTGSGAGRPLETYMRQVDAAHAEVRDILQGEQLLEIDYETDIDEMGAGFAYEKICRFLGKTPREVTIRIRKANPFPISSTLTNYNDLVARLEGTEFAWMLKTPAPDEGRA